MLRRKGQYNRIESLKQEISERRDQPKKRGRGRPKGKKHKPKRPCETLTNNGGNLARSLKGSRGQANREARGRARGRARGHGRVQRLYVKRVCEDFWVTTSNADSSQPISQSSQEKDDNHNQSIVENTVAGAEGVFDNCLDLELRPIDLLDILEPGLYSQDIPIYIDNAEEDEEAVEDADLDEPYGGPDIQPPENLSSSIHLKDDLDDSGRGSDEVLPDGAMCAVKNEMEPGKEEIDITNAMSRFRLTRT